MSEYKDELYELKDKKYVHFEEKYGWFLWSTDVYVAFDPK